MHVRIIDPGPQATLQGAPRRGFRQSGMPAAGPADPLSHALANRLVNNSVGATCIEVTYGPFKATFGKESVIAVTGAEAAISLNGTEEKFHSTITVRRGDQIEIGRPQAGLRFYIAIAGGFQADQFLGSTSTYLPAKLGGKSGRALQKEDELSIGAVASREEANSTPAYLILPLTNSFALRATEGPDYTDACSALWSNQFVVTRRASRIGLELDGSFPKLDVRENFPSSAVFPGALQLPPQGRGFLLLPDCQTTGGYPHVLQVNRTDRHLLGQIRPDDSVIFLRRSPQQAASDLKDKKALFSEWIGADATW